MRTSYGIVKVFSNVYKVSGRSGNGQPDEVLYIYNKKANTALSCIVFRSMVLENAFVSIPQSV